MVSTDRPLATPSEPPPASERELVVMARPEVGRGLAGGPASGTGADVAPLRELLEAEGATVVPLSDGAQPDLPAFYTVEAPEEALDRLAAQLRASDLIEAAYIKPPVEPFLPLEDGQRLALDDEPPSPTSDLTGHQGYLEPAPEGVDARHAWTVPGGTGAGVQIVNVNGAWQFTHEDLQQHQGGLAGGTPKDDVAWRNQGTNVIGVLGADDNGLGVTGICPDAEVRGVSYLGSGLRSAAAIRHAADLLSPGDILLLTLHRRGPRGGGASIQQGFIPPEWWEDDFQAIRYAVDKGVIVVETAADGFEDLDDPLYETPMDGFPAGWKNPFNRANRDSGAIVAGAGAPPSGRFGPDRSRPESSNWGSMVDVQGWGRQVASTGGHFTEPGELQGGTGEDRWYTDSVFGGLGASAMVAGVLGCVQGTLRAHGLEPLTPARAREALRATGSPQQDAPDRPASQRIGNRPDLRQLLTRLLQTGTRPGVQFTGTVDAGQTQRWFTSGWPASWQVAWTVVPTTPRPGAPQIRWTTEVERASEDAVTYWIGVTNLTGQPVGVEGRYTVLGR